MVTRMAGRKMRELLISIVKLPYETRQWLSATEYGDTEVRVAIFAANIRGGPP